MKKNYAEDMRTQQHKIYPRTTYNGEKPSRN